MITKIINGRIICKDEIITEKSVYIKDDIIFDISDCDLPTDNVIDAKGLYVSAGFIDLHLHGALGGDFADGNVDSVIKSANHHCGHGTTTLFPTTLSASYEKIMNSLAAIKIAVSSDAFLPNFGGVHLEGPYFSKSQTGAQNPDFITPPVKSEYETILNEYGDIIARWSFAPELAGTAEFVDALNFKGVVGSFGHSDAKYSDIMPIYKKGVKLITHFYSCTSTITREKGFRKLGLTEFGYLYDDVTVEAIADGWHIPKELFSLLYKIKGADNICLITDSMRCCGNDDEFADMGGIPVKIKNGVATLMDESAFAGSIATADRLVRFCVNDVGIDICRAVKMMTINPARVMGLEHKGEISAGYDADIILFDEQINIAKVIVRGRVVI